MAEEFSLRRSRPELRSRTRAPSSQAANPLIPAPRRIIPEAPKQQVGARRAQDVASSTRDRLLRAKGGPISLPNINAVALSAQNQASNAYQEGLGRTDAYQAGVGQGGQTSESVLRTMPKSYEGEDVKQKEFMESQAEMNRTQEQFLPGSTGFPEQPFEEAERERELRTRPTGPEAASEIQAAQASEIFAASQAEEAGQEEEAVGVGQAAESLHRAIVVGADFYGGLIGVFLSETVIGGILGFGEVLASMNTRLVIWGLKIKRGSLIRKIEPPAQYPFEVTAIVTADILIPLILFVVASVFIGVLFVIGALISRVPGFPTITGLPSITPPST